MGKAFEEIHAGLQDALIHAKGEKSGVIEHKPRHIDVKASNWGSCRVISKLVDDVQMPQRTAQLTPGPLFDNRIESATKTQL